MDLAMIFGRIASLVNTASDLDDGWDTLRDFLESGSPDLSRELDDIDIRQDVQDVAEQVRAVLKSEPPPETVDAIYFGLFDTIDDSGEVDIGYYVSGAVGYAKGGHDALCPPAWWPDRRYLASDALSVLRRVEAAREGEETCIPRLRGTAWSRAPCHEVCNTRPL